MSLLAVVNDARDRYVRSFVAARDERMSEKPDIVSELLISLNTEDLEYPYRYLRVDLVRKEEDGTAKGIELLQHPGAASARSFTLGKTLVDTHPFTWCSINFLLSDEPGDIKELEAWIERWLDLEDLRPPGTNRESLAIHSCSPLRPDGSGWLIHADFGTAPAEALMELLDLLATQGVRHVSIR